MSPVPKEERDKPTDDNPESNNVEDESIPEFILGETSSEDEAESESDIDFDFDFEGYDLLSQEFETADTQPPIEMSEDTQFTLLQQQSDDDPQNSITAPVFPSFSVSPLPAEEAASMLWNQPNPVAEMDAGATDSAVSAVLQQSIKGQEERVRAAMKGFQLPHNNIPDWAKNVPEDKWKDHLLEKLEQLNTKDSDDGKEHEKDHFHREDSCPIV